MRHEIPEPVLVEEDGQVVLELNGLNRSDNLRVSARGQTKQDRRFYRRQFDRDAVAVQCHRES